MNLFEKQTQGKGGGCGIKQHVWSCGNEKHVLVRASTFVLGLVFVGWGREINATRA